METRLTREDYHHTKPDPEPYRTAVERFAIRPDRCLVVEDSQRGLDSAVAAGLPCLIVLSPWTSDGDFRAAHGVVCDVSHVPGAVMALAGSPYLAS
jgi:beta-phosphoglucomutase-like phosphatase (HAD superfamily)